MYVVNFWATWCKPCVAELPAFDKVSREFRGQHVKFILVNIEGEDSREKKIEPFVRKMGLDPDVVILLDQKPHIWIDKVDPSWSGAIPATLFVQHSTNTRTFQEREMSYTKLKEIVTSMIQSNK